MKSEEDVGYNELLTPRSWVRVPDPTDWCVIVSAVDWDVK